MCCAQLPWATGYESGRTGPCQSRSDTAVVHVGVGRAENVPSVKVPRTFHWHVSKCNLLSFKQHRLCRTLHHSEAACIRQRLYHPYHRMRVRGTGTAGPARRTTADSAPPRGSRDVLPRAVLSCCCATRAWYRPRISRDSVDGPSVVATADNRASTRASPAALARAATLSTALSAAAAAAAAVLLLSDAAPRLPMFGTRDASSPPSRIECDGASVGQTPGVGKGGRGPHAP